MTSVVADGWRADGSTAESARLVGSMASDDRTRRWRRHERPGTVSDAIQLLRRSIIQIREAPEDPETRRRLRAIAAEHELWDQLALLLADEARAHHDRPAIAAVFYEELADVHHALDQPLETIAAMEALIAIAPEDFEHHERIAALYRQAGAWSKAADAFEQVGMRGPDQVARAALLDAARLHRENGSFERAAGLFRKIVDSRPTDLLAWRALDDVLSELGRWREVAEVRGERAARAVSGFEKAALLRAEARARAPAGDLPAAARVVARASSHAPADVSGLVDQADMLARAGQGREAAGILRKRIAEALEREASPDDVAALRWRLAQVLEDSCDDRPGAAVVLGELLAASPKHLAALERIAAQAATDPDPRVHAAALLRYAGAISSPADRATYVAAAGRRLRDAGDVRRSVQVFEQAVALAGDDPQIRRELEDVRTSAIVERAASDAGAGDPGNAEQQLRGLLGAHRHHLEANLALVDLLVAAGRLAAAAEHLRDTLATLPDGQPSAPAARLVHRLAQVMEGLGDADESHQLLYEAQRLDRSSIVIALALGESCFARKLWRQAALHLAAAAEHPDAARHAAAVTAGLIHAAQAEVRALRPANAGKHFEAAVRIDPGCAPAWHGLAQVAIERGELVRAAECLEREANATTDARDRLRLFDALGDMALDVLVEPARAERCWRQVEDAGRAAVLDKLLALQRKRGATVERAETCERLARLQTDLAVRKALLIEAVEALAAGSAVDRVVVLAEEMVDQFPRDPDVVVCASTIAFAAGDPKRAAAWARRLMVAGQGEDARAGLELVAATGVPLSDQDQRFLDEHPLRSMASDEAYAAALDDDDRRELVDDPAERPLRDVLELLGEILPLVCPTTSAALLAAGAADAVRVTASSEAATAVLYPQVARALGGPPTLLYTTPHAGADLTLLVSAPPVVIIGSRLASVRASSRGDGHVATDAALRFQLGRIVELSLPHRVFAALPEETFALLVAGLRHGFGPAAGRPDSPEIVAEAERLRSKLPVALRQRMSERLAAIAPDALDPRGYVAACQRAADRAGLLACGDVMVAIQLAGGARVASHLVRLASSRRYLAVRKKLRAS